MELAEISTVPELAAAFQRLREPRVLPCAGLGRAELPPRDGRRAALPSSTLSDLLAGRSAPSRDTVLTFLAACGLTSEEARQPWLRAWARVTSGHQSRPSGAVRVNAAQPRLLGVHAAIRTDGTGQREHDDELPPYVPRDLDDELRRAIAVAGAGRVRAPDRRLVSGQDPGAGPSRSRGAARLVAAAPGRREAVREFATAHRPDRGVARRTTSGTSTIPRPARGDRPGLVARGAVVVATFWPGEYHPRARPRSRRGQPDMTTTANCSARPKSSPCPESSARRAAPGPQNRPLMTDPPIQRRAGQPDAGLTQVIAAGPRRSAAGNRRLRISVTARPSSPPRSTPAASAPPRPCHPRLPGRCRPRLPHQAPHSPPAPIRLAGPRARLRHHAAARRRRRPRAGTPPAWGCSPATRSPTTSTSTRCAPPDLPLPDATWRALAIHHHPHDALRLADQAERRGANEVADTIYRRAIDAGNASAAIRLATLLARRDHVAEALDILRSRTDDVNVAARLVHLLLRQGCVEEVRTRAEDGDAFAAVQLAQFLERRGDVDDAIDVLRPHADPGGGSSGFFDRLLGEKGLVEELDRRATDGDPYAAEAIAEWLTGQGRVTEAVDVLRVHGVAMSSVDDSLVGDMADLLVDEGRADEAADVLRSYVDGVGFDDDRPRS